ncbi:GTPase IMAP family member 9-like [Danio aesculapii]|uniref:GTPase IMAP family member 9-like n=1 Tax=Danio aesculapii TaxID=1142201 RepID=UPI0024BFF261|nr:GTPase IMAP family member 9-like [Danio aesculapii]
MGSNSSKDDQIPLLLEDELSTLSDIKPVFEDLKLVLIGCRGAGKNTVANAIFGKKVFTYWTVFTHKHIPVTQKVSGRRIQLSRTPGWKGDLSRSKEIKREIVHCVQTLYDSGPHAVLLVLNVNSELSISTIITLENILTHQLWKHTIVIFTNAEKDYSIEDYIRSEQLLPFIEKCGQRYIDIQKADNNQIIEMIEELVASKNSASCFNISKEKVDDKKTLLSDWSQIVKRLTLKINVLSNYKEKLKDKLKQNGKNKYAMYKLLDAKDAEIKRLTEIVQDKEREIANLQSRPEVTPDQSMQLQIITELKDQLKVKDEEIKEKDDKIEKLEKRLQMWEKKKWRTHEDQRDTEHASYRSELGQNITSVSKRNHTPIQLQELASNGLVLHGWDEALLEILRELMDDQLKRFKDLMHFNKEWKMPRASVDGKTRGELVDLIIQKWGKQQSVLKTRDLVKKIPRNELEERFRPFLEELGERW